MGREELTHDLTREAPEGKRQMDQTRDLYPPKPHPLREQEIEK